MRKSRGAPTGSASPGTRPGGRGQTPGSLSTLTFNQHLTPCSHRETHGGPRRPWTLPPGPPRQSPTFSGRADGGQAPKDRAENGLHNAQLLNVSTDSPEALPVQAGDVTGRD